jgi:hypothetical protein
MLASRRSAHLDLEQTPHSLGTGVAKRAAIAGLNVPESYLRIIAR